ncbi:hypothetical protein [Niveibacterium sp. SC-1]|uniref:hypothetical protein n=1 Tax=Niveibacterium sp. SC-1 TaxID=3135646 RepID=UPI00311E5099
MPQRDAPSSNLRQNIAALAARLVAEDGITDYALAKRKAARQLGITHGEAMPNNAEIEAELRAYVALYRDEEDDERLEIMRETAVSLMRLLAPWRPALTGSVLDGSATGFAEVELDLFADSAKDVEIFLLGEGIHYEHREIRHRGPESPEAILIFDWDEVPIKLCIFDLVAERSARRNGGERARLPAVEALLAQTRDEEEAAG